MKRYRRAVTRTALAVPVMGLASVAVVMVYRHVQNLRSELSAMEWTRLKERVVEQAVEETPAPPAERERLPRPALEPEIEAQQLADYEARRAKSVVELQRFRSTERIPVEAKGARPGTATLVNLNPAVNAWYVLELEWSDGARTAYHLVNSRPREQDLALDAEYPGGVTIVSSLDRVPCELWSDAAPVDIEVAASSRSPYVALCNEEITLRLPTPGRRTTLEWATDFLRDNVRGGESITVFVRENFFRDAYLETSGLVPENVGADAAVAPESDAPREARLAPSYQDVALRADELGLSVDGERDRLLVGRWYRAEDNPGVFVSALRPNVIDGEILERHRGVVNSLDSVEAEALVYVVAFDLDAFDLGFALGTEHPRVMWSERTHPSMRDDRLPGPDGIGDISPLVATGIIPRSEAARTVAAFTGGFKRAHGAFRSSELAFRNHGSHYGFIESGTVLSKLQPGLATLYVLEDGHVDMKTWQVEDDQLLPRVKFARQNGVPIIDFDPTTGASSPGALVGKWGPGNWSGSQDNKLRTVRAGVAIQEVNGKRFLLYAYFSSATPSAMARVFQAFDCKYAMLTDMNALEHTYLALYRVLGGELAVEHLVRGMNVLDRTMDEHVLPRFLGFADNRDFFYMLRREEEVS